MPAAVTGYHDNPGASFSSQGKKTAKCDASRNTVRTNEGNGGREGRVRLFGGIRLNSLSLPDNNGPEKCLARMASVLGFNRSRSRLLY
jgi:hypothetical protein